MKKLILLSAVVLVHGLLTLPAGADEMVSLKAGYVTLSADGEFTGTDQGFGTPIDLDGQLDFDDSDGLTAEAALQLGAFRLSAGYMPLDFSGSGTLTSSFVFNGEPFVVGERVDSDIEVDFYDIGLAFHLLNFDDLPIRVQFGPELSVKVVDGEVSVASATTGRREAVSGTAGLPTIGGRLRLGFSDFLAFVGRVGYAGWGDNDFFDLDAQLEFSPVPLAGVYGGYRHLDFDIDESGLVLDSTFAGPYGGVFVRF